MADDQHRDIGLLHGSQLLGQPVHCLNVKMVGWLIQNQQVMIGQQQCHQRNSAALTAAQGDELGIEVDVGKQVLNDRPCSRVGGPHVVWCVVDDDSADGRIGCDVVSLMQETDRKVAGVGDSTRIRLQRSRENLEQGGLSGSVAAYDPHRLTTAKAETDAVEESTGAVAHGDALGVDQVAH